MRHTMICYAMQCDAMRCDAIPDVDHHEPMTHSTSILNLKVGIWWPAFLPNLFLLLLFFFFFIRDWIWNLASEHCVGWVGPLAKQWFWEACACNAIKDRTSDLAVTERTWKWHGWKRIGSWLCVHARNFGMLFTTLLDVVSIFRFLDATFPRGGCLDARCVHSGLAIRPKWMDADSGYDPVVMRALPSGTTMDITSQ